MTEAVKPELQNRHARLVMSEALYNAVARYEARHSLRSWGAAARRLISRGLEAECVVDEPVQLLDVPPLTPEQEQELDRLTRG